MTLKEAAIAILRDDPEIVLKTPELMDKLAHLSNNIYSDPYRRRGRNQQQVFDSVEFVAIEHGLSQRLGIDLPDWRNWSKKQKQRDLVCESTGTRYECKKFARTYFSFAPKSIKTTLNNLEHIDFIVVGEMTKEIDLYRVFFRLVIDAKTFPKYIRNSMNGTKNYYDHRMAVLAGHAIYKEKIDEG